MKSTDFDAILRDEMAWAMEIKQQGRIDDADNFPLRVSVIGPGGQMARTPLRWTTPDHKYAVMDALSALCKLVYARAAIITTDSRFLNIDAFCIEFNLPTPTPETLEAWDVQRHQVMERYDFSMAKLPRHTWDESLIASAYGPHVAKVCSTLYDLVGDRYVFQPTTMTGDDVELKVGMIPKWW